MHEHEFAGQLLCIIGATSPLVENTDQFKEIRSEMLAFSRTEDGDCLCTHL